MDGFAKINIVAMQKILLKLDTVVFAVKESNFHKKLNEFLHELPLQSDEGCTNERRRIRNWVAKYYFDDHKKKAFEFLESNLSISKPKGTSTLMFL